VLSARSAIPTAKAFLAADLASLSQRISLSVRLYRSMEFLPAFYFSSSVSTTMNDAADDYLTSRLNKGGI
jgi:hypothetical protein